MSAARAVERARPAARRPVARRSLVLALTRPPQRLALLPGRRPDLLLHDRLADSHTADVPTTPTVGWGWSYRSRSPLVGGPGNVLSALPGVDPAQRADPRCRSRCSASTGSARGSPGACSATGRAGALGDRVPYVAIPLFDQRYHGEVRRAVPAAAARPDGARATSRRWSCCSSPPYLVAAGARHARLARGRARRARRRFRVRGQAVERDLPRRAGRRVRARAALARSSSASARPLCPGCCSSSLWKQRGLGSLPLFASGGDEHAGRARRSSAGAARRDRPLRAPELAAPAGRTWTSCASSSGRSGRSSGSAIAGVLALRPALLGEGGARLGLVLRVPRGQGHLRPGARRGRELLPAADAGLPRVRPAARGGAAARAEAQRAVGRALPGRAREPERLTRPIICDAALTGVLPLLLLATFASRTAERVSSTTRSTRSSRSAARSTFRNHANGVASLSPGRRPTRARSAPSTSCSARRTSSPTRRTRTSGS